MLMLSDPIETIWIHHRHAQMSKLLCPVPRCRTLRVRFLTETNKSNNPIALDGVFTLVILPRIELGFPG
jgi:hypothetical protein